MKKTTITDIILQKEFSVSTFKEAILCTFKLNI